MFDVRNESLASLFKSFDTAVNSDPLSVSKRDETLWLPNIESTSFQQLFDSVRNVMYGESAIHYIEPPCIIFGDLHGHFIDIIRNIKKYGYPNDKKFVFLGDILDRGEFSIETITYIFLLKYFYKENVVIVRGNHEFENVFMKHGFEKSIKAHSLNESAISSMITTLNYLPFACIVGKKYFCVHGGIGPSVTLEKIKSITIPFEGTDDTEVVQDLVWSDPTTKTGGFDVSPRRIGHLFGEDALNNFLSQSGLSCMIRAHEMKNVGVEELFGGKLFTVFSASNYCGVCNNYGGTILIKEDLSIEINKMKPLQYIYRCNTLNLKNLKPKEKENCCLCKFMPNPAMHGRRQFPGENGERKVTESKVTVLNLKKFSTLK